MALKDKAWTCGVWLARITMAGAFVGAAVLLAVALGSFIYLAVMVARSIL